MSGPNAERLTGDKWKSRSMGSALVMGHSKLLNSLGKGKRRESKLEKPATDDSESSSPRKNTTRKKFSSGSGWSSSPKHSRSKSGTAAKQNSGECSLAQMAEMIRANAQAAKQAQEDKQSLPTDFSAEENSVEADEEGIRFSSEPKEDGTLVLQYTLSLF